jgi:hypothetical protein
MMGLALPTELLMLLDDSCPCRAVQVQQLTILYNVSDREMREMRESPN